jgi:hypothetical protein
MYDRSQSEIFFIGQWKSHLILGKGIHGRAGYREVGIRGVLRKGEKRFVAITSGPDGTRIYIDGALVESSPKFHLQRPLGQIVLGNSPTGREFWTGSLLGLAIYSRVLTGDEIFQHKQGGNRSEQEGLLAFYPLDERSGQWGYDRAGSRHLFIPPRFEVLQKTVLVSPWKDFRLNRSYVKDVSTNILGFIPFGFFFPAYLWLRKPRSIFHLFLASLLFAGFLSLSIELAQVYLPARSSQLTDVITNILGAAIGAALFIKSRQFKELISVEWNKHLTGKSISLSHSVENTAPEGDDFYPIGLSRLDKKPPPFSVPSVSLW